MKRMKAANSSSYLLILAAFLGFSHSLVWAESAEGGGLTRSLPLVFDPATKKYFIGGNSKFSLKGEQTGLIERIEISVDGADYQPYSQSVQFSQEGKHTLKFRAIDPVNNWSPVQFVEVFVDLTAPTTEVVFQDKKFFRGTTSNAKGAESNGAVESGGQLFLARNSTVSLVAQDNLSGIASVEYSWDNSNFNPYTRPILIEKAGAQTLYYRSIDKVGNTEATKTLAFVSDGAAPTSSMKIQGRVKPSLIQGHNYLSASDSVAFSIEANDDASGVRQIWVSVDGKPMTAYLRPIFFLQEGPHSLKYFAEDAVGNQEEPKTLSLYTVSNAPRTVATILGKVVNTGGINFAKQDFQLKLDAQDNAVGLDRIEYKTDRDSDFRSYLEPIRFATPGMHTVYYRSVDRAGNMEPAKTYVVNIVDRGPETSIETAQPLVLRNGITYSPAPNIVTLNVKNSGVGLLRTLISVNDQPFTAYQGPLTLNASQRVFKLTYKSVDKLGIEESPKTVLYHMVGTIPAVDLFVSGSGSQNQEEQIRTNYFDPSVSGAAPAAPHRTTGGRAPASMGK